MDIVCEFCDKSFDSKSKVNAHQRTKKCQQFRTITFVCRKCSSAILGYDNILFHVENCNGTTPILHKEIEDKIKVKEHDNKIFFGKGLNGKTVYIFNYEKSMLTYGSTNIISESIVSTIDNLVEKATLKSLNDAIQSFSKESFLQEILFKYPQPFSISDISKFFEYESRTVMAFLMAKDLNDLFEILFKECKLFPVCIVNDDIYVIDKVVRQNLDKWILEWKQIDYKEVSLSLKGFFLPVLNYAIKLFLNESNNNTTLKLLELIKEIADETKIRKLMSTFTKPIPVFEDIQNIFQNVKYIYNGSYKHTPMDTFIKNISYGSCFVKEKSIKTEHELYSLLMSLTKESEKTALIKKIKMNDDDDMVEIEKEMKLLKV